ncbi:uncharacterized protein LOC126728331 [Quercus robur]|uniref:uncharacterized protein LOC126728331 n=1 Tax=Quercus robur TaxID=38942 RepID=UPI002161E316|nr:uncharacterized protein LOC126728331 [Quercus robur]
MWNNNKIFPARGLNMFSSNFYLYNSFTEMLGPESLAKVLPGVETIEEDDGLEFWPSGDFSTVDDDCDFLVMVVTMRTCPSTSIHCLTFLEKILSLQNYSKKELSHEL